MRRTRLDRLARWGTGAVVLFLLHGLAAPRPAWAGCNHLVVSESDRTSPFHRLDAALAGGGSSALTVDPAPEPPNPPGPRHPAPCSGPGCSRRVPLPAPTAVPDSDRSDQWVVLSAVAHLTLASPPHHTSAEPAGRPTGEGPSIFHPPPA
jgi:hypothetical protein